MNERLDERLTTPYFVPDELLDETKYFPMTLTEDQLSEDRWIKAVEFRPGSEAVHHIICTPFGGIAPISRCASVFKLTCVPCSFFGPMK